MMASNLINLKRTLKKLLLVARAVVAIKNPAAQCHTLQEDRPTSCVAFAVVLEPLLQRAAWLLETSLASGTFTNQIQAAFWELRLLVIIYLRADHQRFLEVSYHCSV